VLSLHIQQETLHSCFLTAGNTQAWFIWQWRCVTHVRLPTNSTHNWAPTAAQGSHYHHHHQPRTLPEQDASDSLQSNQLYTHTLTSCRHSNAVICPHTLSNLTHIRTRLMTRAKHPSSRPNSRLLGAISTQQRASSKTPVLAPAVGFSKTPCSSKPTRGNRGASNHSSRAPTGGAVDRHNPIQ
jgi:hypothetical protein